MSRINKDLSLTLSQFGILNLYFRLIQNRISAQRFRIRRKNEMEKLKETIAGVEKENRELLAKVEELNSIIRTQQEQISRYELSKNTNNS